MNKDNLTEVFTLAEYKQPEAIEDTKEKWVEYGEDNDHYSYLDEVINNSVTHSSVVKNMSRLIVGRGLYAKDAARKPSSFAAMKSIFSEKDNRKVATELKRYGTAYYQVHWNKNHTEPIKAYHIPTKCLRPEKCNKDGDIEGYWYSDDWTDVKNFPPQRYSTLGTSKDEIEIYRIQDYSPGKKYFAEPDYSPAIAYAVLEHEISDYLINTVQNRFSGTKVVNFNNGVPDPEQRRRIARETLNKLTGSKGQQVIISFNKNQETKTDVDDIPLNDAPQHYEYLSKEAEQKILIGHRVTSPMLVGVVTDNQGFSSNADEIETAARYFYNAEVKPFQDLIIDGINEILAYKNIHLDLFFRRLNLLEEMEEKEQAQEESAANGFGFSSDKEAQIFEIVNEFGEEPKEDWELIDEREVDYELEDELDAQLKEYEQKLKEPSTLKKIWNFVSTGTARGNASSTQDKEVNGFFFKVRYEYVGNATPERDFCKAMMRANKVYRKEDIQMMSQRVVNAGFGIEGADKYDIWRFKGGPNCYHKWQRKTYVGLDSGIDVKSPLATTVSTAKAREFGYRVTNEKEVSQRPIDMPNNGYYKPRN